MADITIKELIELKNILSTDSISTTRLSTNDNFRKLRKGLIALIDTLQVNEGPNVVVDTIDVKSIVADEFAAPLSRDGVYNFRVNSNGEIFAKNLYANTGVRTSRLRLEPDPTTIAFQAGELRWSGLDWLGWNGSAWVSLSAGAAVPVTTGPLVINQLYKILNYSAGDDFTNIGASSNANGVTFVATGTTPAVWTNGSILTSDQGEVNTASNVGSGAGVFKIKAGVDMQFKRISGVSGVTVDDTTDPNTIIISTAISGVSGQSGISGISGISGVSTSGYSGFSGLGFSGASGVSGFSGKGLSGFSGITGTSGFSGFSGLQGASGYSGKSGISGIMGVSGFSGISGLSGLSGGTGSQGFSGFSGVVGPSGFSGISGMSGAGSITIGPAENGTYLDGIFTDFVPSTPIGTAVDRFNELFLYLVPTGAPALTDWDQLTLGLSVPGKLSFDTTVPIPGYIPADIAPSPVFVDGLFNVSGKRLGITQAIGGTALTGVLNYQVLVGPGSPTPSFTADSFGDAEKGSLRIYVNGIELVPKRIDLTVTTSAQDTTFSNTVTGFSVSAQSPAYFPGGAPFANFQNRTGTWRVNKSDLTTGYNYIVIEHYVSAFDIRTLDRHEVVVDGDVTPTVYSAESMFNPTMGGILYLSGIQFNTGGQVLYNLVIDNAYRNTYSSSASAISFTGNTNSYGLLLTATAQALANNLGNEASGVNITSKVATFVANRRVINETVTLTTTVLRTVQGTTASPGGSLTGFLLDSMPPTSTEVGLENFDDEQWRLNNNSSYDTILSVTTPSNAWDSQQSLNDGSAEHITGLQVIGGQLIYPGNHASYPTDFQTSAINFSPVFNNGGIGGTARNYTGLTGTKTYIRRFKKLSPTTANFVMTINGIGGTFVSAGTALTGNNVHVHVKGPTQTGWMDAYADFVPASWLDNDGARDASNGAGRAYGTPWGLTMGTKNTALTGGYMIVRITVGVSFTGDFTSIIWNFS